MTVEEFAPSSPMPQNTTMRIAKFLARAGIASRRKSEVLVEAGRVSVNGEVVTSPATSIHPETDHVVCDGKTVRLDPHVYLALNKPPGYTCSAKDRHAKKLIAELYPPGTPRLFTAGRLDRDSEGLIICTNDGDLAHRIMHPRHEILKEYHVRIKGKVTQNALKQLEKGILSDGEQLKAEHVSVLAVRAHDTDLKFILGEGKNREIRRMCDHFGWSVQRLCRVAIGPLRLGDLNSGQTRPLTADELHALTSHYCSGNESAYI